MGDLCDQVLDHPQTILDRFSSYADFCEWSRDFPSSNRSDELWIEYWGAAAKIFELYDQLPTMSDWDLYEEIFLSNRDLPEMPDEAEEAMVRGRIIQTSFALTRWITGKTTHEQVQLLEKGHHSEGE
jgi:hypothetical protein